MSIAKDAHRYKKDTLFKKRRGSGVPSHITEGHLIRKGANNAVYMGYTRAGERVVIRKPRRGSDSQYLENGPAEFLSTALADRLGVAPVLHDAWYVRHRTPMQVNGLHLISDHYPSDIHELMTERPEELFTIKHELGMQCKHHIWTLANAGLFCYDLKAANMVYKTNPPTLKFVDFGSDMCEYLPFDQEDSEMDTPVLKLVRKLARTHEDDTHTAAMLYTELSFAAMVVILSANMGFTLSTNTRASRVLCARLTSLNILADTAVSIRTIMSGSHVKLLKTILRHPNLRNVFRHYMGRRNAGTKRVLAYASFQGLTV